MEMGYKKGFFKISIFKIFRGLSFKDLSLFKDFSLSKSQLSITLSLILILSFLLRIYRLDAEDLWVDEVFSINISNNDISGILTGVEKDMHPPLYYIFLHYWSEVFGYNEFVTRIPSVIAGVISIYVLYKLGKVLFKPEIGIIGAFILSTSLFHIRYSQEARSYVFIVLFILLSNYFMVKILKGNKENRNINIAGYIISTVVALYTHYYAIFYVIFQNIYYFSIYRNRNDIYRNIDDIKNGKDDDIKNENNVRLWIILQGTILLLFAPWLPVLIEQSKKVIGGSVPFMVMPTLDRLYKTFITFTGNDIGLYILIIIGMIYVIRFYIKNIKIKNNKDKKKQQNYGHQNYGHQNYGHMVFLLLWLFIPIMIPFTISQIRPMFVDRYVIASIPALALLMSVVIYNFRKTIIILILVIMFIIPIVSPMEQYYDKPQKEEWRDAVKYIIDHQKSEDFIIVFPKFRGLPFAYYYNKTNRTNTDNGTNFEDNGANFIASNNATEIKEIIKGYPRIWLVSTIIRKDLKDESKEIEKTLSTQYSKTNQTIKFKNIKIDLYKIKNIIVTR